MRGNKVFPDKYFWPLQILPFEKDCFWYTGMALTTRDNQKSFLLFLGPTYLRKIVRNVPLKCYQFHLPCRDKNPLNFLMVPGKRDGARNGDVGMSGVSDLTAPPPEPKEAGCVQTQTGLFSFSGVFHSPSHIMGFRCASKGGGGKLVSLGERGGGEEEEEEDVG